MPRYLAPYHYNLLADVAKKRFSVNAQNTQYVVGPDGTVKTTGIPDILYDELVIIRDASILWTHGKAHHFNSTAAELDTALAALQDALKQVEQAQQSAETARTMAQNASAKADAAQAAAAQAKAASEAIKQALDSLHISGNTESLVAQVLSNAAEIAALKEQMQNLPTGGSDTNIAVEFDGEEGDLYLITGTDSRVMSGELTDDGELVLDINII